MNDAVKWGQLQYCSGEQSIICRKYLGAADWWVASMQGPVRTAELEELRSLVGQEVGVSEWTTISQQQINQFADLTGDHQPIHVDEQVAAESPFGRTLVHGFLVLSLLSNFAYQVIPRIRTSRTALNYGFNRIRFVAPVRRGDRVRGRFLLQSLESRNSNSINFICQVSVEIEGEGEPALVAEWITTSILDNQATL